MDSAGAVCLATEEAWRALLERHLACPVEVVFGRSRTHPIQTSSSGSGVLVRMHRMFAAAPLEVGEAVAHWIRSGRRARRASVLLDDWIDARLAELAPPPARAPSLVTRGEVHDLLALARPLLAGEFARDFEAPEAPPRLTWGRRGRSRTRHSIRLGSYAADAHLVRIHAALDQAAVPDWYVRTVLFHELLHAARPPRKGSGSRWIHHDAEFRAREESYRDHERAVQWQERNLRRLLASARRGTPMRVRAAGCARKASGATRLKAFIQRELFS